MNIEKIKKDGQISELRREIDSRIFKVCKNTFVGFSSAAGFTTLGEKIDTAQFLLREVNVLLDELHALDEVSR